MGGGILATLYHWTHPNVPIEKIPYYYKRSVLAEIWHLIRKGICQNIAPNCVLTPVRIGLYRMCGFKIGKGCFIGMKCYFDDLCVDKIVIGDNVTVSYGVYFACHGRKQGHNRIEIKDGAYVGMRASITARHDIEIGKEAIVGAMSLVNKSVADGETVVGVPAKPIIKKDNKQNLDMNNYKLYKGAWVSKDPINEQHLTDNECANLLNRGGVFSKKRF